MFYQVKPSGASDFIKRDFEHLAKMLLKIIDEYKQGKRVEEDIAKDIDDALNSIKDKLDINLIKLLDISAQEIIDKLNEKGYDSKIKKIILDIILDTIKYKYANDQPSKVKKLELVIEVYKLLLLDSSIYNFKNTPI